MKIAVFLLAALLSVSSHADSPGKDGIFVGKASPDFEAADLSGAKIASSVILKSGKAIVLNFWGLRCGACIMEMPHLNSLSEKYRERANFYGINVDAIGGGVLSAQIKKMKLDIGYTVVPDPDFKLVDLFRMAAAPLTIIIDVGGVVRYRHEGYEDGDEVRIEEALKGALRPSGGHSSQ
jgi:thiol-disulfide isomerase/thioredoxin